MIRNWRGAIETETKEIEQDEAPASDDPERDETVQQEEPALDCRDGEAVDTEETEETEEPGMNESEEIDSPALEGDTDLVTTTTDQTSEFEM